MKKHSSVVCIMAFACHMSARPSLGQGTEPLLHADERPIHAAIATAGDKWGYLLSQTGGNRISRRQGAIIAAAAAIGFGAGYGIYYYKNRPLDYPDDRAHAMAAGTFSALIAGMITWMVVAGP